MLRRFVSLKRGAREAFLIGWRDDIRRVVPLLEKGSRGMVCTWLIRVQVMMGVLLVEGVVMSRERRRRMGRHRMRGKVRRLVIRWRGIRFGLGRVDRMHGLSDEGVVAFLMRFVARKVRRREELSLEPGQWHQFLRPALLLMLLLLTMNLMLSERVGVLVERAASDCPGMTVMIGRR